MSTEPGNTNASNTGRGAADGHREDTATRAMDTDAAAPTAPLHASGRGAGSHAAEPVTGYANDDAADYTTPAYGSNSGQDAEDTRTRVAPVAASPAAGTGEHRGAASVSAVRDHRDVDADGYANRHEDGQDRNDRHDRGAKRNSDRRTEDRDDVVREASLPNREALLAREKERFGGFKFGSAFFGWLTATGMVVLLSALAAAIGAAVGVSAETDLGAALESAAANQSAGIIGAIIMLLVLVLSYFAGGYVAGRMARFNGAKQGLAVWLWALVAGVVVIILGLIFGSDIRSISQLNSVAPLPEDLEGMDAGTWIAVAASVVATLLGAVLGGLAGMRYHRRIDRADYRTEEATVR
ncbi:hypothetical protein GD627_02500 [Arthrobacter yangruifuii]|uniref:Uncharacterized protein n=1 Tax=Arthrobacter yangruifuii TaxID=2606616 RepID=A0A5N6MTF1_9MICC|nr:YrzE family protein [Arthrobacter yangruifuii]KAD4059970.1 hypothetical protein GD627_02500 [Arthrobacter yangruifuii]